MKVYVTTEIGTSRVHHLLEDATKDNGHPFVRKWQILQPFKNGWIIQSGLTQRLIFPIDFDNYYIE